MSKIKLSELKNSEWENFLKEKSTAFYKEIELDITWWGVEKNNKNAFAFKLGETVTTKFGVKKVIEVDEYFVSSNHTWSNSNQQTLNKSVEIEYESEPKILKRPDGSLISEPKKGVEVILIQSREDYALEIAYSKEIKQFRNGYFLKRGFMFLVEDEHLAEKKTNMLTKQLEITNEIERLNAEQGWVADWGNDDQEKCNFCYSNSYKRVDISYYCQGQSGVLYSSEDILTEIKDKYSEDELKQFLGIII